MTNPDEYEGWRNRETWAVSLHLSNTAEAWKSTLEIVKATKAGAEEWITYPEGQRDPVGHVAQALEVFVSSLFEPLYYCPGAWVNEWVRMMAADVGSLWRVDYVELARNFLTYLEEEAE